jgi:hypothetical protein
MPGRGLYGGPTGVSASKFKSNAGAGASALAGAAANVTRDVARSTAEVSIDANFEFLSFMKIVPFKQGLKGDREKKLRTQFSRRFTGSRGRTHVERMDVFNLLAKTNSVFQFMKPISHRIYRFVI